MPGTVTRTSSASARAPAPPRRRSARTRSAPTSRRRSPATPPAAPAAPAIKLSETIAAQDPRFQQTIDQLQRTATRTRRHDPPAKKAAEAEAASEPPKTYKEAGAKANKVIAMKEAKSEKQPPKTFLDMLRAEIARLIPKKVKDIEGFMEGDDRQQLNQAMTSGVQQQKAASTGDLHDASAQPLEPDRVPDQPVTRLPVEPAPRVPANIGAAQAMPLPRPEQDVSLQAGKRQAEQMLRDRKLTDSALREANDPRFSRVVTAKAEVVQYADTAPLKYRQDEQAFLGAAQAAAHTAERRGLGAFLAQRLQANTKVKTRQLDAKAKDEAEQQAVVDHVHDIYKHTKQAVDEKLTKLDQDVAKMFDQGADAAVADMRKYVEDRFDDRYSGISGKALKLKDWVWPLPDKVKAWFPQAHQLFVNEMDTLIVRVANLVEARLKEAKDRIDQGDTEVHTFVMSLPDKWRGVGLVAEKDIADRFADLRRNVEDKKKDLAQGLAQRYKEAREKGDKALQQLKDKHKSLLERFGDWLGEVWDIISNFGRKLVSLLSKAASVIWKIVTHPIRFLEHLVDAAIKGVSDFREHFLEHLMNVLAKWLFGHLADRGVTLPKDFSPGSLFKLALEVLGLTRERIRGKVERAIGERNVTLIEQTWSVVQQLLTGGVEALWERVQNFIGDLKSMVLNPILAWITTEIVKAGVKKLLLLFAPAGAIIEAIKAIYHIITFFIDNIREIGAFLEAVGDSIVQIVEGQISAAAKYIENALERAMLMVIRFLANYLGLSGIASRIRDIVESIRQPIENAMDRLIGWLVERGRGLVGRVAGIGTGSLTPEQKLIQALDSAQRAVARFNGKRVGAIVLRPLLSAIRLRYQLRSLDVVPDGDRWAVEGVINPRGRRRTEVLVETRGVETGDIRQIAGGLLRQRLNDNMDEPAISATTSAILAELKPQGLTRLDYHPILETGELEFMAASSPPAALFRRFFWRARRRPYAQLAVTMRSRADADLRQGLRDTARPTPTTITYPSQLRRGGQTVTETVDVAATAFVSGQGAAGSMVVSSPARGDVLQMVAWNTNTRNYRDSTGSHAERQFIEWFDRQTPEWRASVKRVVFDINVSPCSDCTQLLCDWSARYPDISATLRWRRRYPGTTNADIAALGTCFRR